MGMIKLLPILYSLMFLVGCSTNLSPSSYSVGSVGQVNRTIPAIIISVRDVNIEGTTSLGASTGAIAGAAGGSYMGGSTRAHVAGAALGAVAVGLAGAAIEKNATKQTAVEYVVETNNGNLMTLVQGTNPRYAEGDRVLVLYGAPARIIADPRK